MAAAALELSTCRDTRTATLVLQDVAAQVLKVQDLVAAVETTDAKEPTKT